MTVEGYQHGASWGTNSCALSRVSDYLVNGTVPQEETTCSIDPLPEDIAKALAG
ncbi:alpha/beta hydrolase [Actinomyces sp. oral taxon 448]|uniref:alpha/beta hydrolase n=1 Tax=Actinomyces sp. oral taxon 448 TaxID=712124 RepID=UPI00344C4072